MLIRTSVPFQTMHPRMMPPHVAAGYYNSTPIPASHVTVINNLNCYGQSNVPLTRMLPANLNQVNHLHSVSANVQNPFADQPVVRYERPLTLNTGLMHRDVQTRQQFSQQPFLLHVPTAASSNALQRFAYAGTPLMTRPCIPVSVTHARPTSPVFQPPLVQTRLSSEQETHQGQVKVRDVAEQQFSVSCAARFSSASSASLLLNCGVKHAVVVTAVQNYSPRTSVYTNLQHSNCREGLEMGAVSVSVCSAKVCEPTITTMSHMKPLEAVNLSQSCVASRHKTSFLSTVKPSHTDALPENCSANECETKSAFASKQLRTSSSLEVCNSLECHSDSIPSEGHIRTSLPMEQDSHFTEKELQTTWVSERNDIVKNPLVALHSDMSSGMLSSPLSSHNRTDSEKSLRTSNLVTAASWDDAHVEDAADSVEDSPLGWPVSEANSLVRSVRSIIERRSLKEETEVDFSSSQLTNVESQDEVWMMPADARNIWNTRASQISNSSHMLKPSVVDTDSVDGALGSNTVNHCDVVSAEAGQATISAAASDQFLANAVKSGFYDQQDIWPTLFGPFTQQSENTSDHVCRLPPGLETQVIAKFGVIGQRIPQMQSNASVEGSDSGVESVSGDSQCPVSSISELSVTSLSSSSETAIVPTPVSEASCSGDAVERQSLFPSQEPSTPDDVLLSKSSLLIDILSAMIIEIAPRDVDISKLPQESSSEDELRTLGGSCLPPCAAEGGSSHSDVDSTSTQTATTLCELDTSQPASNSVRQMLCTDNAVQLRDTVVQLYDILCKRQQHIHKVLDSADNSGLTSDKLAIGSTADCSSQNTDLAKTLCEVPRSCSCEVPRSRSSTEPHTSVSCDRVFINISAGSGQDEGSLVDADINLPVSGANTSSDIFHRTLPSVASSTRTKPQTPVRDNAMLMCASNTSAAVSQNELSTVEEKLVSVAITCNADSVKSSSSAANPNVSLTVSLPVCDTTAAVKQLLPKVAVTRVKSLDLDKCTEKCASDCAMDDLLVQMQRWKL